MSSRSGLDRPILRMVSVAFTETLTSAIEPCRAAPGQARSSLCSQAAGWVLATGARSGAALQHSDLGASPY